MINDVELFLEHHGVRGMRWGEHLFTRTPKGDFRTRSKGQKAALIGGGVAGWATSNIVGNTVLGRERMAKHPFLSLASATTSAVMGVRATRAILDKKGNEPLPRSG